MTLSLLLDMLTATGLCGGGLIALADLLSGRLGVDMCGWTVDGGVEEPYTEFSVDDDFVVGTVSLDSKVPSEPCGDPLVPFTPLLLDMKLVFRRRNSLKKGIEDLADKSFSLCEELWPEIGEVRRLKAQR